jgi:NRAMP (natural resistance-associated macrophage protein)-like metal ion transporter
MPVPQSTLRSDEGRDAPPRPASLLRSFGLGVITGAADDDCSAVGTYSQAGATFGYTLLWTAPFLLPMMVTVVYLSSKLGQVTGQGLFDAIRSHYPKPLLYAILTGAVIGNTIEAGADIGGMAAALHLLIPVPQWVLIISVTFLSTALQVWGSYKFISNFFRLLSLALLAYVVSMFLANPDYSQIGSAMLHPHLRFDRNYLSILVAMTGTALSAYLFTWQSNEEVEEKVQTGQLLLRHRRGTTDSHLRRTLLDVFLGMFFSALVMYAIVIATAATLHASGKHNIDTAADAAKALAPLAGKSASLLFTTGILGVGFLALPVMTTGAAYDVCQSFGHPNGLDLKVREGKVFYATIVGVMTFAAAMNFAGVNPMKALVFAGIVQGFSTPPLMLLIMLMTNRRRVMGSSTNGMIVNILGWTTTVCLFAATIALMWTWVRK